MCAVENAEIKGSNGLNTKNDYLKSTKNTNRIEDDVIVIPFFSDDNEEFNSVSLKNLKKYFAELPELPKLSYFSLPELPKLKDFSITKSLLTTEDVSAPSLKKTDISDIKSIGKSKDVSVDTDVVVHTGADGKIDATAIWNSIDPEERELVKGKDLLARTEYGDAVYQIVKGSDGKYHIYEKEKGYAYGTYKCVKKVAFGSNYYYQSVSDMKWNPETRRYESQESYQQVTACLVDVGTDVDVQHQGGNTDVDVDVNVNIDKISFYLNEEGTTDSPLVIDFNGDGKVDAQAGIGVDIDGDGIADGAAINGDKMLAMSDVNGNGTIDGTEVFGNKTVNPFTGEAINAKNGFEALKQIAISAQKISGINCFDGQNVNLINLRKVLLEYKDINLGFVSDKNNSHLENLSKISSINVTNYLETPDSGWVQHNQQGFGSTQDGDTVKVDDVWFKIA